MCPTVFIAPTTKPRREYVHQEYPKWVGGVVVEDRASEIAVLAIQCEALKAAEGLGVITEPSEDKTAVTPLTERLSAPSVPGEVLSAQFLEPLGLSARALARDIGVPANRVTEIINGVRAITADTALRLAERLGTTAEFWMNLQMAHDLAAARRARKSSRGGASSGGQDGGEDQIARQAVTKPCAFERPGIRVSGHHKAERSSERSER